MSAEPDSDRRDAAAASPAGEPEARAGWLKITMPASTDALEDHLSDCRDLAELLVSATRDLPDEHRNAFLVGLVDLSRRLECAVDALEADTAARRAAP